MALEVTHWYLPSHPTLKGCSPCPSQLLRAQQVAQIFRDSVLNGSVISYLNQLGSHNQLVQSLSHVQLFANPRTAAHQASLSITNPRSLPKLMSIESVRPLSHLILCRPLSSHLQSFPASGSFPICASNTGSLCLCPLSPLGHGQPLPLPAFSPGTPVPPPSLSAVTPRGQVPLGSQHSGPASQEVR